jgi:hypothetical protein
VCRRADNQGVCTVEQNICTGGSISCGTGSLGPCVCYVTTTGRSFCGAMAGFQLGTCGCASNQECEQRLGLKGAKCVVTDNCPGCPSGATSGCMAPCENLDPVP